MQVFTSGRFGPFEVSDVAMDHHRAGAVPADAVHVVVPTPVSREQATALLYDVLDSDDVAAYDPRQVRQLLTELVAGGGSAGVIAAQRSVEREQTAGEFGPEHWKACSRLAKQVTDGWARPPEAARGTFGPVEIPEVSMEHHRLVGKHAAPGVPVAVPVSVSAKQMAALLYDADEASLATWTPSEIRRLVVEQIADGGSVGISEALHAVAVEREAGDPVAAAHWEACQRRARELVSDVTARIRDTQAQQWRGPMSPPAADPDEVIERTGLDEHTEHEPAGPAAEDEREPHTSIVSARPGQTHETAQGGAKEPVFARRTDLGAMPLRVDPARAVASGHLDEVADARATGPAVEVPAQDRGGRCRSAVEAAGRAVAQLVEHGRAQHSVEGRAEDSRAVYYSRPDATAAGVDADSVGVAR